MTSNPTPDRRAEISAHLWQIAEQHIIAEWICCEPLEPRHDLCAKGHAALGMVKTLLVDSEPGEAWLDELMGMLPPSADRATVYAEVAERLAADAEQGAKEGFTRIYRRSAAKQVREWAEELAAEAQPEPACTDPIECSHEAALGQAEETLEVLHALGTAWSRPTMSAPTRVAGEHLLRVLGAAPDGVPAAGVRQPDTETPVPCSWVAVRSSHSPHDWQPQPGMDPVHCPGYRRPPMDPVHILGIEADQPAVPQRPYPDCERCGDSGTDPEQPGQPCPECQRPAADDSGEEA